MSDRLQWSFDVEGGEKGVRCGGSNFFSGWVISLDEQNPATSVEFVIQDRVIGSLPVKQERPDLLSHYGKRHLGFWGPIALPARALGSTLAIRAVCSDGSRHRLKELTLDKSVPSQEVELLHRFNLPDDTLRHLVVTNIDPITFIERGKEGVEMIKQILQRHSIPLSGFRNVLDFGVGCGRIIRWWESGVPTTSFWGTDINPELIAWCSENIPFAKFSVNELHPPTSYPDGLFDLVYAYSVFTHLTLESQESWLAEFARIVTPRGYVILSTHGENDAAALLQDQKEIYQTRGYLTMSANAEGENMCATYQSLTFSDKLFSGQFRIVEHMPGARSSTSRQDVYLLQKK